MRGYRVPYEGEEAESTADTMLRALKDYYMLYLIIGLSVTLLIIFIMKALFKRKKKTNRTVFKKEDGKKS